MRLMYEPGGLSVLTDEENCRLLDTVFTLLERQGVAVENDILLERFASIGAQVDRNAFRARFPRNMVEAHLERVTDRTGKTSSERSVGFSASVGRPVGFSASAEIYHGLWLDPDDGALKPWNLENWQAYVRLAQHLPHLDGISMLGCPMAEIPSAQQPLYEKLYCWKYGLSGGDAIWNTGFCEKILEMHRIWAEANGRGLNEVFRGTVYLISPLRFGHVEAEQYVWFHRHGLQVNVGWNGALGGGLPVTIAGAVAVQVAEAFFVSMLQTLHFGPTPLHLGASISVLDMRSAAQQYGRPEKSIANMAMSNFARWLGATYSGHCGLSDAKAPGAEAGMQKATSAIFHAAAGGQGYIAAGLLGTDEIFSPIQLILDSELTGSLKRISNGLSVDEDGLALDAILEEGPGGAFIGSMHTAEWFREVLWQPSVWSSSMTGAWKAAGGRHDVDLALEKYHACQSSPGELAVHMEERVERELRKVIES